MRQTSKQTLLNGSYHRTSLSTLVYTHTHPWGVKGMVQCRTELLFCATNTSGSALVTLPSALSVEILKALIHTCALHACVKLELKKNNKKKQVWQINSKCSGIQQARPCVFKEELHNLVTLQLLENCTLNAISLTFSSSRKLYRLSVFL